MCCPSGLCGPSLDQTLLDVNEMILKLQKDGVHIHLYGKKITKPFRKMGHVTVTSNTLKEAIEKANYIKNTLKVIA
jgi:phosphoribosylaminoimidazole carboxylase (NCAIR synthetase)